MFFARCQRTILGCGDRTFVDNARNIVGLGGLLNGTVGDARFVGAVKDLATNNLKPNQLSGETQFTMILGDVILDYGDANDPRFPTVSGSNGAAVYRSLSMS